MCFLPYFFFAAVSLCATATHRPPRRCHTLIAFTGDGTRWPLHVAFALAD